MVKFLKKYPFHPILLSIYPILNRWFTNYSVIAASDVIRSFLLTLILAGAIAGLLRILKLSVYQIGLIISLTLFMFFSYGHLTSPSPVTMNLLYLFIWIFGVWAILRWAKNAEFLNVFLNLASLFLVLMVVIQMVEYDVRYYSRNKSAFFEEFAKTTQAYSGTIPANPPDIYYIILDGYGRQDALKTFVHFDNSAFIQSLKDRGFTVAADSTSNYETTVTSLASSLNFHYINDLTPIMGPASADHRPLRDLIRENQVMALLKNYGYTTIAIETGFNLTEIKTADQYVHVQAGPNTFESLLLSNALSKLWITDSLSNQYANRMPAVLKKVGDLTKTPSPKFVFAHIMAAHSPYIFGVDGEIVHKFTKFETHIVDPDTRQDEIEGYRNQVTYINNLIIEMIDEILATAPDNSVIVIQGDHGSDIYMDGSSAENTCFDERKSILNAYYLPDGKTENLYDTITPVNSFRVIFNTYLGTNFPLLEDRNYFSLSLSPYNWINVTGVQGKCP